MSGGRPAKLEYASLSFDVEQDHVDRPLYFFFRTLNFTEDGQSQTEGCISLYMEAEFTPG